MIKKLILFFCVLGLVQQPAWAGHGEEEAFEEIPLTTPQKKKCFSFKSEEEIFALKICMFVSVFLLLAFISALVSIVTEEQSSQPSANSSGSGL